jgi:acyl-CoA thioesterase I
MSIGFRSELRLGLLATVCVLIFGCAPGERNGAAPDERRGGSADARGGATTATQARGVVLFVGTSLTAGLGLDVEEGYPARVQEKIDSAGLPYEVVNAGVSGETSAAARRRLESWLIRQPFDVLVIETGANDMLRGADADSLRANLQAMIDTVRSARPEARIVLAGMVAAPNLGRVYGERFAAVYGDLARENDILLIPFLLEDVAGDPDLNLPDGIHPNADGQRRVAETVWEALEPLLRREAARSVQ